MPKQSLGQENVLSMQLANLLADGAVEVKVRGQTIVLQGQKHKATIPKELVPNFSKVYAESKKK